MERLKIQRKENTGYGQQNVLGSNVAEQAAEHVSRAPISDFAHSFGDISVFTPEHTVQRKATSDRGGDATDFNLSARIEAASGTGTPLEQNVQAQLETGVGADLSGVRVHDDSEADQLSRELHANAFTTGDDIFFRQGLYNPSSGDGMRLLAHEATHTVQQANGAVDGVSWGGGVKVSEPNDRFEQEAEATAQNMTNSSRTPATLPSGSSSAGAVQREAVVEEEKDKPEQPIPDEEKEVQMQRDSSHGFVIQRDPSAAAAPAGAAPVGTSVIWQPPFDLPACSKKYEAAMQLLVIAQQLNELKEAMGGLDTSQIDSANKGVRPLVEKMRSEEALTRDDVNMLEIASGFAKSAVGGGRQALTAQIAQVLSSMSQPDTGSMDSVKENLDEEMRKAFLQGKDASRISQIKSAIGAIKEYQGHANDVADWAKKANVLLKSAKLKEFLEAFGKRSKQLDAGLKYVGKVLDAAKFIDGLIGKQGPGQSSNSIANFQTSIKGIDIVMGFASAVPGLGQLWNGYYKPLTEACIKHVKYILELQDEQNRDMTLATWAIDGAKGRGSGNVPIIPPPLMSAFPGGQSVLNYMYPLVNGSQPAMTPEVETFFVTHKSLFNAGAEKDEIDTEWHFFGKKTSPNLIPWINRNADTVWAMLYGNMQRQL